ncbi:formate dehydrogenase accessory protein [Solidesulfovibrio fructosivorans JJ]]|uniref:Formate dehydrogenase accessory protein n=1 Tax=Solidesulfovibrio fructosivorans JJ] TaxID=596151 RepID=E1JYX8_SOLFR|nr:formate dehydrogenase accessory protein FdhE [Solidesulfovibrio fructosivorans]EFL50394.1 formate dehydrogenase accessory protein [Solidesulfovibrio fructosivorans JJ]]
MPFDAAAYGRRLEKKLADIAHKTVLPAPMVTLVAATCRAQLAERAGFAVTLDPARLEEIERVLRGATMLARDAFPVDAARAETFFAELSRIVREDEPHLAVGMAAIDAALASGELDIRAAFARHVAGDDAFFAAFGERTPDAPRLLAFLAQAALAPQLAAIGEAVYAHFPADRTWSFGQCPVCGAPPLMARLVGKEGARHLTCSFCQLEYRAKRLMCPYCGEEDHKLLEVFTAPDEPGYAVHVCLRCRNYIKTADFRDLDRPSVSSLDDLESLTLDIAARNQGYARPVLSAWGF